MKRNIISILFSMLFIYSGLFSQDEINALYNSGLVAGSQAKFDSARTSFRKVLELDSLYLPAKFNWQVAEDVFSGKLPEAAARCYFLAIQYGQADNLEKKIEQLNKALQISPDFGLAYNERAICHANKSEYDLAIKDYNKAIQLLPQWPEIYINLALSCDKSERWEEAKIAYTRFLELAPSSYDWYIIYARKRLYELQNPDSTR
jgi:tetratricopeptide (TPR) repeat protein